MLFFTVILVSFLAVAELDLYIPCYPELQNIFQLTPAEVQYTLTINFISFCATLLFVGPLADRYGEKCITLFSLAIYGVGSILCTFADTFSLLLAGRFVQGFGIAAISCIPYLIIVKTYTGDDQTIKVSTLNGIITASLALAPTLGSFITSSFGWRGNFAFLFMLAIFSFLFSFKYFPKDQTPNYSININLKCYVELLKNKLLQTYFIFLFPVVIAFWTFIAMGPILFMQGMEVDIKTYGLLQGSIIAPFAIVNIMSAKILKYFELEKCLNFSMLGMLIFSIFNGFLAIFITDNPFIIAGLTAIFCAFFAFPNAVVYPMMLRLIKGFEGRISVLLMALRLIFTAISVEVISFLYNGHFFHLGIFMTLCGFLTCFGYLLSPLNPFKNKDGFKSERTYS